VVVADQCVALKISMLLSILSKQKFEIRKMSRKSTGFTLIELLIAVAIISILSGLLMMNYVGVRQRTRDGQRKSELRQIQTALEFFRSDTGGYPNKTAIDAIACGGSWLNAGNNVTYMPAMPCDPTTKVRYNYVPTGVGNTGYTITACLENDKDGEADSAIVGNCEVASYTLLNP
jgi:general secretion pathway protein G